MPEVPEGPVTFSKDGHKLRVVCVQAETLKDINFREPDVIYVYLGEMEGTCTREDGIQLLRWVAKKRTVEAKNRLVAVAFPKNLEPQGREEERRVIKETGAELLELHDSLARQFFETIVEQYAP